MEVECSRDSDSQAFCKKHGVSSFPVLSFFTGDRRVKVDFDNDTKVDLIQDASSY